MNNTIRNTLLAVIALAVVSLSARNFSGAATTTTTAPARHYYLTKANFNGNQALTACTTGYHFASFAELFDPSVITYNKSLGRSQADDGAGPPSGAAGWVRSGYVSNTNPNLNGQATSPTNCSVWTSGATSDDGEAGSFVPSNGSNQVFEAGNEIACDNSQGFKIGVWCMEN